MSPKSTTPLKMVTVMRHDLHMRMGKAIAQGQHAVESFWIARMISGKPISDEERSWAMTGRTKITLRVESEAELTELFERAHEAGLTVHLVTDAGHTEFAGVPTKTCICIGPNKVEQVDAITGGLKLL